MDQELPEHSSDPVVVTGLGYEIPPAIRPWFAAGPCAAQPGDAALSHDADPLPFLRLRKTAKFMSKQDRLAMSAAARAVRSAGLSADVLETQTPIVMGVGPIPFQKDEALRVAEHSRQGSEFSMERYGRDAYDKVNPLLLFACLPNMPAYHISANLNIRGGYYLTYPSCVESYLALRNAASTLAEGRARAVLYGGVADQQNFLVQNHHRKTGQARPAPDCACFLVLETRSHAQARQAAILARLQEVRIRPDFGDAVAERSYYFGSAELPLEMARFAEGEAVVLTHRLRDNGYLCESDWLR